MLSIKKIVVLLSLMANFGSFYAMEREELPFKVQVINNVPNIRALGYQFVSLPIEVTFSNQEDSFKVTQQSNVQLPQLNEYSKVTIKLYGEYKGTFGNLVINPITISAQELINKAQRLNVQENATLYIVVSAELVWGWPFIQFTVVFRSSKPEKIGVRMPDANKVALLAFPELKQKGLTTQTILTRLLTAGSQKEIEGQLITIKKYPIKEIWRYILELPENFTPNQLNANYKRLNKEWGKENFPNETQTIRLIRTVLNNAYVGLGGKIIPEFPAPEILPERVKEQQQVKLPGAPPVLPQQVKQMLHNMKDMDPELQAQVANELEESVVKLPEVSKEKADLLDAIRKFEKKELKEVQEVKEEQESGLAQAIKEHGRKRTGHVFQKEPDFGIEDFVIPEVFPEGTNQEAYQKSIMARQEALKRRDEVITQRKKEWKAKIRKEGISPEVGTILYYMEEENILDPDNRANLIEIIKTQQLKTRAEIEDAYDNMISSDWE